MTKKKLLEKVSYILTLIILLYLTLQHGSKKLENNSYNNITELWGLQPNGADLGFFAKNSWYKIDVT